MNRIYLSLVFAFAILSGISAQCSLYPVPLSSRVSASSLIVQGKVVASKSFWNAAQNYIYTSHLVNVKNVFKGPEETTLIEVITEGGEIGTRKQTVEPSLQLKPGDEGVFTLNTFETTAQFGHATFRAYADVQGFIRFDLFTDAASEPFKKYNSINKDLYPELEEYLGGDLTDFINTDAKYGQNSVASVSGISPLNITAGTSSIITITGSGFGATQGTSTVEFFNADDGGSTFIKPHSSQYVSWSNTMIQVMVPTRAGTVAGTAGTGPVRVTVAGSPTLSAQTLTVDYGELNLFYSTNSTVYNTRHVDLNGSAGITWQMFTSFDANASAKAAFLRSFQTWRCNTYINWVLGPVTSTNTIALDGINIVRFDITTELPVGVLGRCTSYFSGCSVGPNIFWYVDELDICFDDPATSAITWQFGPTNATGIQYDFESVSLHELGHGHQLSHVINSNDVMHYALANAQNKRSLITQNINGGNDVMIRNVSPGVCGMTAMTALNATICLTSAPTASFNLTPSVCAGQSVSLSDLSTNSPTSWSWTMTGGSPASSTVQNTSVVFSGAGVYSVSLIATNGFGASTALTKTINVVAVPLVNVPSGTICSGTSTILTASGASSYTWNPGPLSGASQTLNPVSTAFYTITGSNGSCSASTTATLTVDPAPALNIPNASICSGNSTLVTAGGATSYTWEPGTLTGASQNLSPGATTIYTVTGSAGNCTSTISMTVNVTSMPTVSVADASICSGTSTLITATGAASFVWNPGNLNGAAQNLNPSATTVYTVTGSNGICSHTAVSNVSVTSTPTIIVANAGICAGSSTLLTAGGANSYTWNPGNLGGASQNLNPAGTIVYTISGSIGTCTGSANTTVSVTIMPTVSVSDAHICSGTSTLVTATGAGAFFWNPGNLGGASQNLNPASTTVYTITGSNGSCTHSASMTVSVTTTPTLLLSNADICSGTSTLLTAGGANTYTWNPGNLTGASQNLNPAGTTIYTVSGSVGTCTSSTTITLSVTTTPTVSVSDAHICSGTSTLVTASGATSFVWNPGNLGGAAQNLNPNSTAVYTVTGNNGACTHSVTMTLSVTATPTVLVPDAHLCSGTSTLLTASGANSYVWNPGNLTGASQNLNPMSTVVYTVTGTIGTCSSNANTTVSVTTTPTVSVPDAHICSGTSTLVTATGAGVFVWNPGNLAGASQNLNPLSSTQYTVTGNNGICTHSVAMTLSVTTTPTIIIPNADICSGTSTLITASGANSYTWNPGNLNGASQTLNPLTTLIYTVSGNIGICTSSSALTLSVTTTPTVSAPNATVCSGSPTVITATGATNYSWNPGALSGATQTLSPLVHTTYTITGNNGNCTHSQTLAITTLTIPSTFAMASHPVICATEPCTLSCAGTANSFTWSSPGFSALGGQITVFPNTTTIYTVIAIYVGRPCTSTHTVQISVIPNATIQLVPGSPGICSGSTVTLTASGSNNYTWTPGGSNATLITVSPITTSVYVVSTTHTNNCVASASVAITVTPTPIVSLGTPQNIICSGQTTTLIALGATAFTWQPGVLTGSVVYVSPSQPGQQYTVTGGNGICTATNAITVLVNPTPTVSLTGLPATICQGGSVNVSSLGADVYTWSPGNIIRNSISPSASLNPLVTTVYTLTGMYFGTGCKSSMTGTLTVIPSPTLTASVSPTLICSGATATISSTGATAGYSWSPIGVNTQSVIVAPATNSTYIVTGSNGTCTSVKSVSILVYPGTTLNIPTASICSGASTMVIATGALNYTWLPVSSVSSNTLFASPLVTTVYTVTGQNAWNCFSTSNTTVFVTQTPTPAIVASSPTVCSGVSATLTATNASNYVWNPGGSTASAITVTPGATTLYTLTGINGNCSNNAIQTLTVVPNPVIVVPGANICSGNSTVITASGASSFTWTPGNLNGASQILSPVTTSIYAVSGTSAGCSSAANVTITVTQTPTLGIAASPTVICPGQTSTLQAGGALSYLWSHSGAPGFSVSVAPGVTTNYMVYGSIGNCTAVAQVTVLVNPSPTLNFSASQLTLCGGSSETISVSGADTYTWAPLNQVAQTLTLSPAVTTIYTVTGSYTNTGCEGQATATVNVLSTPTVMVSSNQPTLCSGATATLNASGAAGYTWSPGNLSGSSVTVSPTAKTTYTVEGSLGNCKSSALITLGILPNPTVSLMASDSMICAGETIVLTPMGASGYTLQPGNIIVNPALVSPTGNTTYSVLGEDAGCFAEALLTVTVSICDGITATSAATHFKLFPNPAQNSVIVDLGTIQRGEVCLFTTLGQVLVNQKLTDTSHTELDLSAYAQGVYFVKVIYSTGGTEIIKLVKD